MKKIAAIVLAVAAAFALAGCAKSAKKSNKFVLGLDDSFPPMGYRDADNNIVGYDIDLAKEVTKRLGLELVCQPIDWSAKEMELKTGKIDCIWNGLTMTEERQKEMEFSEAYLENAQVVVVRADSGIKTLADLSGKKVGVQAGSSAQDAMDAATEFKASLKEVVEFQENVTALNDLEIKSIDGVVMDLIVANYSIQQGKKDYVVLEETLAPEKYGIAFSKSNKALRDSVQKALEEMAKDGTLAEITKSWFGSDISKIGK
ncbi:MAG: amino acid ABC transporter substrate-binding protein [Spirochaetales bacterium]|nr:amino acid ABC transporter substrate-binding protein [Spirochaetales bacterium]